MNEREKSLKLAELMGWVVFTYSPPFIRFQTSIGKKLMILDPYGDTPDGLAQFAAIPLKFPEVMKRLKQDIFTGQSWDIEPTQANILDEILRMNGVDV